MGFDSSAVKVLENNRREIKQVQTGRFPSKDYLTKAGKPMKFKQGTNEQKRKFESSLETYKMTSRIELFAFWALGIFGVTFLMALIFTA